MAQLTNISKSAKSTDDQTAISLSFDTGESYEIPAIELRFECPCASCVDEMSGKRTLKKETLNPKVKPMKISPVGNYGIHVVWSDGHSTGMYHFDRLLEISKAFRH